MSPFVSPLSGTALAAVFEKRLRDAAPKNRAERRRMMLGKGVPGAIGKSRLGRTNRSERTRHMRRDRLRMVRAWFVGFGIFHPHQFA